MKLLLVTGFLGAGKTAFLKHLISQFGVDGRLYVIVNEFGKEGVDGTLLRDSGGIVREIAGGSVFCSCRMEHFENALDGAVEFFSKFQLRQNMAKENSVAVQNLIIVETSGFSDPTKIAAILAQTRFAPIEYAGCLCLIDALFFEKVFTTARAVKKQLGVADAVLLNKSDCASVEQKERVRFVLSQNYPNVPIFETVYGALPSAFFTAEKNTLGFLASVDFYAKCKKNLKDNVVFQSKDITQQKMTLRISSAMSVFDFEKAVAMFIEETYRIKGIVRLNEGLFLADCVGNHFSLEPYTKTCENCGALTLLAGADMNLRKAVTQAAAWYTNFIRIENDDN